MPMKLLRKLEYKILEKIDKKESHFEVNSLSYKLEILI